MKSRCLLRAALLVALTAVNFAAQKNELIGYRHAGVVRGAKLPNGAKDLGGGLLSSEDYGVSRFTKGGKFMLWLEKIVGRSDEGIPTWQVTDVLTFPKLKKGEEFFFSYGSGCTRGGKQSLDLIVQTEFTPKTKTYKVKNAWRANVNREKFQKISTKNVECAAPIEP